MPAPPAWAMEVEAWLSTLPPKDLDDILKAVQQRRSNPDHWNAVCAASFKAFRSWYPSRLREVWGLSEQESNDKERWMKYPVAFQDTLGYVARLTVKKQRSAGTEPIAPSAGAIAAPSLPQGPQPPATLEAKKDWLKTRLGESSALLNAMARSDFGHCSLDQGWLMLFEAEWQKARALDDAFSGGDSHG